MVVLAVILIAGFPESSSLFLGELLLLDGVTAIDLSGLFHLGLAFCFLSGELTSGYQLLLIFFLLPR